VQSRVLNVKRALWLSVPETSPLPTYVQASERPGTNVQSGLYRSRFPILETRTVGQISRIQSAIATGTFVA
jgi:hypothetical protein